MKRWIGHSVLGRRSPSLCVSPLKPTQVGTKEIRGSPLTCRANANPRHSLIGLSVCHTIVTTSQLAKARILLIAMTMALKEQDIENLDRGRVGRIIGATTKGDGVRPKPPRGSRGGWPLPGTSPSGVPS